MANICLYKCDESKKCCRSTCENHCKVVSDDTCKKCMLKQDKPFESDKSRFKRIIKEVIDLLDNNDVEYAKKILNKAMRI